MGYTGVFFWNILDELNLFGCVWVLKERNIVFFRVCRPKPFGRNCHFGPYFPFLHRQYSKSVWHRYHDMVIHLFIFKMWDLYLFFSLPKNLKMTPFNRKKIEFSKNVKSLQFPMVQGSLNPNIIFLHEKLWPVAWKQKNTSVI